MKRNKYFCAHHLAGRARCPAEQPVKNAHARDGIADVKCPERPSPWGQEANEGSPRAYGDGTGAWDMAFKGTGFRFGGEERWFCSCGSWQLWECGDAPERDTSSGWIVRDTNDTLTEWLPRRPWQEMLRIEATTKSP